MFKHASLFDPLITFERVTGRGLKTPEGDVYPGITKILGSFPKPGLDAWKKRVGEEEASRIMKAAAARGRVLHETVETHLKNNFGPDNFDHAQLIHSVKSFTDKYIDTVHGIEVPLYSNELKAVGFADLICSLKSIPSPRLTVVDFKTSTNPKKLEYVQDYFLQLTGYVMMIEEQYDIAIKDMVLVVCVENVVQPQYFHEICDRSWKDRLRGKIDQYQNNISDGNTSLLAN